VLLNDPAAPFAAELRFRTDTGAYGVTEIDGQVTGQSRAAPMAVAAGRFDGDDNTDLVVVNSNVNRLAVLRGDGTGGFFDPDVYRTGSNATAVVTGRFDGDAFPDLAVLVAGSGEVWVYAGSASGGFTHTF